MSSKTEREIVADIAQQVLDMPPRGQCVVYLDDGLPFLLSLSSEVGEKDCFKIWVQGIKAIKVDQWGDLVEPYDQFIFEGNFISDAKLKLLERHGYEDIERGKELEFLGHLILEGRMKWIDKSEGISS
jgi:hypothetical protein